MTVLGMRYATMRMINDPDKYGRFLREAGGKRETRKMWAKPWDDDVDRGRRPRDGEGEKISLGAKSQEVGADLWI